MQLFIVKPTTKFERTKNGKNAKVTKNLVDEASHRLPLHCYTE